MVTLAHLWLPHPHRPPAHLPLTDSTPYRLNPLQTQPLTDSIRDITGAEKLSEKPATFK